MSANLPVEMLWAPPSISHCWVAVIVAGFFINVYPSRGQQIDRGTGNLDLGQEVLPAFTCRRYVEFQLVLQPSIESSFSILPVARFFSTARSLLQHGNENGSKSSRLLRSGTALVHAFSFTGRIRTSLRSDCCCCPRIKSTWNVIRSAFTTCALDS